MCMSKFFCTLTHSLRGWARDENKSRNVPSSLVFSLFHVKGKCVASSLLWESWNSVSSNHKRTLVDLNESSFSRTANDSLIQKELTKRFCFFVLPPVSFFFFLLWPYQVACCGFTEVFPEWLNAQIALCFSLTVSGYRQRNKETV